MSVESAFDDMVHLAATQPITLVVADQQAAFSIEPEAVGRAQAASKRCHFPSLPINFQNPSAIWYDGIHPPDFPAGFFPVGLDLVLGDAEVAKFAAYFFGDFITVTGDVQTDVEIAVGIAGRTKSEFVVVAAETKIVAHGFVHIGGAVAVRVDQARQFGTLHDQYFTIADGNHAERFVQAECEWMPVMMHRIVAQHLATMKGCHEFSRRRHCQRTDLRI